MNAKRKAVQAFLDDPDKTQWQDRLIADACHCSTRLVKDMRQEQISPAFTHTPPEPPPGYHPAPPAGAPGSITITLTAFTALLHSIEAQSISAGTLARKLESSGIPPSDCYRIIRDLYSESGT